MMRYLILPALMMLLPRVSVPEEKTPQDTSTEVTPRTRKSIQKALDFLASRQVRRGYIPGNVPVAATSVACLAFMAEGSTPHYGRYATNIRKGLEYIRRRCARSGFITCTGSSGMYGHGFGTLFLAEAVGMLRDADEIEQTRDALRRAVTLLQRVQNRFGGWNATPNGQASDDGSGAIAIMQIAALRAARNAGIEVNHNTVAKAKKYVSKMTTKNGRYCYNYHSRGREHKSSALTGAGMYMMGAMDMYTDRRYEKGIAILMANAPFLKGKRGQDSGWSSWWPYTAFYSSLAVYQHGGKEWKKWYPAMREWLLKKQSVDGSWPGDPYGGLYTAFIVLALEMPLRYLPIFQEGGRGAEGH